MFLAVAIGSSMSFSQIIEGGFGGIILGLMTLIIGGIVGEAFMVIGYFFFEIFLMAVTTGDGFSSASLAAGAASAISGVPFNIVQGLFGVEVSCVLYPFLKKLSVSES